MIGKDYKHSSLETIQLMEHKYFITKVLPKTGLADTKLMEHTTRSPLTCCSYLWSSSPQVLHFHPTFLGFSLLSALAQKRLFHFAHMTKRIVDH